MKVNKPQDTAARSIEFGIEIETMIPDTASIAVGGYHAGHAVRGGNDEQTGMALVAPVFKEQHWGAERDASITCEPGFSPCEFISPVLSGDEGLSSLREFLKFAARIGARVNRSCGLHITIGIKSVIGTADAPAVAAFVQKLAHIANYNAWAIFAQTGTDRHLNRYSHVLPMETGDLVRQMKNASAIHASSLANQCGRGMVNLRKAFNGEQGAIEFRAFAGTLNESKVLHHLATAFGIVRRAATVQTFGRFDRKSTKKHAKIANAIEAVRRMWRTLGWVDSVPGRDCALGLFGYLHSEFGKYRKVAIEMAEKFEQRFPNANI